jgi:hypothetical protein
MRLAALVLVLVAGAFYVLPLRAFFAAQDGYFGQRAALLMPHAENRALRRQISEMHSRLRATSPFAGCAPERPR